MKVRGEILNHTFLWIIANANSAHNLDRQTDKFMNSAMKITAKFYCKGKTILYSAGVGGCLIFPDKIVNKLLVQPSSPLTMT